MLICAIHFWFPCLGPGFHAAWKGNLGFDLKARNTTLQAGTAQADIVSTRTQIFFLELQPSLWHPPLI